MRTRTNFLVQSSVVWGAGDDTTAAVVLSRGRHRTFHVVRRRACTKQRKISDEKRLLLFVLVQTRSSDKKNMHQLSSGCIALVSLLR